MLRLVATANVVPSSPILVTLTMEALCSFETSALTRSTQRNIPEDAILHDHRRQNIKSYIVVLMITSTPGMFVVPGCLIRRTVCPFVPPREFLIYTDLILEGSQSSVELGPVPFVSYFESIMICVMFRRITVENDRE
jgi:hypothetical protein